MHEAAQEIFDYLPINKSKAESDYIEHLWGACTCLDSIDNKTHPFIIMPFHLLFMLALQYKALRVAESFPDAVNLFFVGVAGRDRDKLLNGNRSVFDLAMINERTLPEIFRLTGLDKEKIKIIKELIDDRNNKIAHARGGIDPDPDDKIENYIDALSSLQTCLVSINDKVATQWLNEISEEDDLTDYVNIRLPISVLCPADFKTGMLSLFDLEGNADIEEWQSAFSRVLVMNSQTALIWLKHLVTNHTNKEFRNKAVDLLNEATVIKIN